jgi:hypothetical protein
MYVSIDLLTYDWGILETRQITLLPALLLRFVSFVASNFLF